MKILIAGGSGLIGRNLSKRLCEMGNEVGILTRKKKGTLYGTEYLWGNDFIEPQALENVDAVVHLAGEGIANGRWTKRRKQRIIESRVNTLRLLKDSLKQCSILVGASGTGIYGGERGEELINENSTFGTDFLAECCQLWEKEEISFAEKFQSKLTIIRTGLVLSGDGGALPKMALPVKFFAGANLGTGKQWLSWIHLDDLVDIYIKALTVPSFSGIVNGVSSHAVRHSEFNHTLAKVLHRKILIPNIPSPLVKTALGEMSVMLLGSLKVESTKKFSLQYTSLEEAFGEIYR